MFARGGTTLYEILVRGYRQHMWIMEAVRPLTSRYFGSWRSGAYYLWGRSQSHKWMEEYGEEQSKMGFPAPVAAGVIHCGEGCTLGDIFEEWAVFLSGCKLAGLAPWPMFIINYALAFICGLAFQYFSIKLMRGLSVGEGIKEALKADTLSLTAFQIRLFGGWR